MGDVRDMAGFRLAALAPEHGDFLHGSEAHAEARSVRVVEEEAQARIDAEAGGVEPPPQRQGRERAEQSLNLAAQGDDQAVAHDPTALGRGAGGRTAGDWRYRGHSSATQNWEVAPSGTTGIGPDSASGMPRSRYQAAVS